MNKYLTKTLAVVTLCGVMLTPAMKEVSAQEVENSSTNLDTTYVLNELISFEDYSKDFRKDLTEDQIIEAKKLFEEAVKYDDTANEAWDKLFYMDIYDNNYVVAECAEYTFEQFSKDLIKEATEIEKTEAKKLFEEAMKLEKNEEYDKAKEVWEKLYNMDIFNYEIIDIETVGYIDNYTFEDFSKELKDDITKDQKQEAKNLFEKAMKLEEEEKYEEAMKVWDELYKKDIYKYENIIIDDLEIVNCGEYTFEDFSKELKDDITKDQKEEAKSLFEKAMKLEEEEKYEEAMKVWDELYKKDIYKYENIIIDDLDVAVCGEYTFEDFSKDFKEDITKEQKEEAKSFFEKALKLEEDEKYEEAMKVWDKLYSLDIFDYIIEDIDFGINVSEQ